MRETFKQQLQRAIDGISSGRIHVNKPVSCLQTAERMMANLDSFGIGVMCEVIK